MDKDFYSHRQFVQSILPDHYEVKEIVSGIIRCKSIIGIEDDEQWDSIFKQLREYFGTFFKEVHHITCTNHVNFTVYYDYHKPQPANNG